MKSDPSQIVEDANKLQTDRFNKRDEKLRKRAMERFNETVVEVPSAYKKTAEQHQSAIIENEGQGIATLVYADPVPHLPAPTPEDQPLTTNVEKFLMAWESETEAAFGPVRWQGTLAQIHDNISVEYVGWRKVPYKGQPEPPSDENDIAATVEWGLKNEKFKKNAGVKSYCDRRYVPLDTWMYVGNVYDPDRCYEVKQVPERDLMDAYGVVKNSDGSYSKPTEATTAPSGTSQQGSESTVKVVEYWDREWCQIVAENSRTNWRGKKQVKGGSLLTEWQHNWGRVPYFARPAFVTDQLAEEKKYAGPLDGIYTEMPGHKKLAVMTFSVAYQTAFSPLQIVSEKDTDPILDASGKQVVFLDLEPGKARQLAPGQKIATIPQSPEVQNLYQEKAASQARIEHYSLSPVAKGVSPGADTANAALSNLHRFQLSTLDPLAQQASRQSAAIYRFILERIEEGTDRYFAFDEETDSYLSLAPEEVVSVNVQAKVTPDQGQFQLLIEKHAAELKQLGLITLEEMYSMWGKENPEEYVLNLKAEKLAEALEPVVNQQIIADLGMLDAIHAMIAQNQQSGDARNAVPGLMDQVQQMNSGQGQGSAGQPRTNGVRSPVVSQTTQPTGPSVPVPAAGGY